MKYYVTSKISENIHETPEGFLVCIGVPIARTGNMVYGPGETPLDAGKDGKVSVTRDEDEVFRPETIASFEGKAVTIAHPDEFVGPDNWSDLAKGVLQNVRRGEGEQKDDLIADLLITDKLAIGLVKNGLREVSCGYEADYIQTDEGKGKQKNIIGNHLALVDQGRAGPGYAINDHKGDKTMNLKERIKAIFAKAQDEAMKMAEDEAGKEDKKDDKKDDEAKDAGAYDELVKMVSDLGEKISAMAKPKDDASGTSVKKEGEASNDDDKDDDDKDKAKDDEASMESRLKAVEQALAKLLDNKSEDDKEDGDEVDDEDMNDEDMDDDDFEESTKTGDTASRAEILAPGIKLTKDVKAKALKAAYATKEGKTVIESLTGGKAPTFDSAEKVNILFVAASEVLKNVRSADFSKSKRTTHDNGTETDSVHAGGGMTAEKMNEINAKHYKNA
jgi:uncharacterized protein